MEVEGGRQISAVPESVLSGVNRTLTAVEHLKTQCVKFSYLSDPDVLADMPPLQRAESLLLLARINTTLFALNLKCKGIDLEEHPVKSEFERLRLYQDKLDRLRDLSNAPVRPSTTLNTQAATRFIEYSLPDLTQEQRQSMRDISRGEGKKMTYVETNRQKKRKFQSPEKKSVQTAAKEFLEKATQELLGDNKGGFKGPLRIDSSEEEEENES